VFWSLAETLTTDQAATSRSQQARVQRETAGSSHWERLLQLELHRPVISTLLLATPLVTLQVKLPCELAQVEVLQL
jgi:hypothetical protein